MNITQLSLLALLGSSAGQGLQPGQTAVQLASPPVVEAAPAPAKPVSAKTRINMIRKICARRALGDRRIEASDDLVAQAEKVAANVPSTLVFEDDSVESPSAVPAVQDKDCEGYSVHGFGQQVFDRLFDSPR